MLSLLRNRLGIPGVIAVFALVFAMVGGAWAAKKYVITSTKQIKPSVLKQLKGAKGANGSPGAPGPAGPAGPAGAAGPAGTDGLDGAKGATGAAGTPGGKGATGATGATGLGGATGPTGVDGADGATGPTGSPWVPDNELPSEATMTGSWGFGSVDPVLTQAEFEADPTLLAKSTVKAPISFTIPLAAELESSEVHFLTVGGSDGSCPGTVTQPDAAPGHLCVYTAEESEGNFNNLGIQKAATALEAPGASRSGAVIEFFAFGKRAYAFGTWAVTAP